MRTSVRAYGDTAVLVGKATFVVNGRQRLPAGLHRGLHAEERPVEAGEPAHTLGRVLTASRPGPVSAWSASGALVRGQLRPLRELLGRRLRSGRCHQHGGGLPARGAGLVVRPAARHQVRQHPADLQDVSRDGEDSSGTIKSVFRSRSPGHPPGDRPRDRPHSRVRAAGTGAPMMPGTAPGGALGGQDGAIASPPGDGETMTDTDAHRIGLASGLNRVTRQTRPGQ